MNGPFLLSRATRRIDVRGTRQSRAWKRTTPAIQQILRPWTGMATPGGAGDGHERT
jgi:hypothetical protein